jgi:hypothetical protein
MWHGYFRIDKGSAISDPELQQLRDMTVNPGGCSCLCGCLCTNIAGNEAIVEICYAVESVEGDLPFGVSTFSVFAGATWAAMSAAAREYIITNKATWMEDV